jgi:nucleoside-diphosphate-sugar epimerase
MAKMKVLVTGASGYVASQMLPTLRERYDCTLVDVRATDRDGNEIDGIRIANLTDPDRDANRALFSGMEAVVHLGYVHPGAGQSGTSPESYYTERSNVDMAFNVYQLSLEEGVRRVVMASSNHAADWYESLIHAKRKDIVDPWERAIADNYYGWSKEAYEHLGFVFATGKLGRPLEVVQVRIGAPREIPAASYGGNPNWYNRDLGAYISPRDLTQLFVKSLEAPDLRDRYGVPFQIFYGISDNTRKFWSITNARQVIGYQPEDDSEVKYADEIHQHLTSIGTPVPARAFVHDPGTH